MNQQIVVADWGDICPLSLRIAKVAGEPEPKAYRPRYPFAVIFFKKLKKEYHKEQIASGIRERNLRSVGTGERFTLSGVEARLEAKEATDAVRYRRKVGGQVKAEMIIEW